MKTYAFATSLVLLTTLAGAAAADTAIAEGDALAGFPFLVSDGLNAVFFSAAAGSQVYAVTTDRSGVGYDVDIVFFDAEGLGLDSSCATAAPDEPPCTVPPEAASMAAHAWSGVDLHIVVFTVG